MDKFTFDETNNTLHFTLDNSFIELCSRPICNGDFIYFITPYEWEIKGKLVKYDISKGRVCRELEGVESDYTVKQIYLKDNYIYMIIGYIWGTITEGGNLYRCDLNLNNLTLIKEFDERIQILNIDSNSEENLILSGYKFQSEDYIATDEYFYIYKI